MELGNRDKESIRLGRAVQNLTGWRKSLVFSRLVQRAQKSNYRWPASALCGIEQLRAFSRTPYLLPFNSLQKPQDISWLTLFFRKLFVRFVFKPHCPFEARGPKQLARPGGLHRLDELNVERS